MKRLKDTLAKYVQEEQNLRFALIEPPNSELNNVIWDKIKEIDLRNQIYLKKIIGEIGGIIFNPQMVGNNLVRDCCLIVQHADNDIEFQQNCYKLMVLNNCPVFYIAYLADRIMVGAAKKNCVNNMKSAFDEQEYYTQWYWDCENNKYYLPINVDWGKVIEKRNLIGMEFSQETLPVGVYEQLMEKFKLLGLL